MPELPDVPYQLPALQGRPEWMSQDWVAWFRLLKTKLLTVVPATPPPAYTSVTYAAGNFTGSGSMTWTVQSGDQVTYAYRLADDVMTVWFALTTTSVGGTPDLSLRIAIPAGKTSAITTAMPAGLSIDNGSTPAGPTRVLVAAGDPYIYLQRYDGANWAASANLTYAYGVITFPVT